MDGKVPETIEFEHAEVLRELIRALKAGGETGEAAVAVMRVVRPHVAREESLVAPLLALLAPIAAGKLPGEQDAAAAIARARSLKTELPEMLAEHSRIVDALRRLMRAATEEKQPGYAEVARRLIVHAQEEEELLYPAAILVGAFLETRNPAR